MFCLNLWYALKLIDIVRLNIHSMYVAFIDFSEGVTFLLFLLPLEISEANFELNTRRYWPLIFHIFKAIFFQPLLRFEDH